jgi:hypothetical protein
MKTFIQENPPRHFGEKELESHVMRKYPAWFGKRVTKKDHELLLWYLVGTLLHSERGYGRPGNGRPAPTLHLPRPNQWGSCDSFVSSFCPPVMRL